VPIARFEARFDHIVERLYDSVPAIGLSGIGDLGTIPRLPELARAVARVRARAVDNAIARVAARYPRTIKSNAWDIMASFANNPEMYGADHFHASAQGHLEFARVGVRMADLLVEIVEQHRQHALETGADHAL
jgi:hypothetical protein